MRGLLDLRRLTQDTLASQIGLSRDKLSKSINGVRRFTVGELTSISRVLGVDVGWLIDGGQSPLATRTSFRHVYDARDGVRRPPAVAEQADLELVESAYLLSGLPVRDEFEQVVLEIGAEPNPSWSRLKASAVKFCEKWIAFKDSSDPVLELAGFLDGMGVDLVILASPMAQRVQTYSMVIAGQPVIVVHATSAWYSALFGVFHEVAHLLFGHDSMPPVGGQEPHINPEQAANWFAANVLVPGQEVRDFAASSPAMNDFAEFCWAHAVGRATLGFRLDSLSLGGGDLPTQVKMTAYWDAVYGSESAARKSLWRTPCFPPRIIERHRSLVSTGVIPPDLLSMMTSTPVSDLDVPEPASIPSAVDELGALGL